MCTGKKEGQPSEYDYKWKEVGPTEIAKINEQKIRKNSLQDFEKQATKENGPEKHTHTKNRVIPSLLS